MIKAIKLIILKYKLSKAEYKWIKVPKDIVKKYRDTTVKNKLNSDNIIKFKINREFYAGHLSSINENFNTSEYGYLTIKRDNKMNSITYIQNDKNGRNGRINFKIKQEMTEIYKSVFTGGDL